jgi:cell division protease FtsH
VEKRWKNVGLYALLAMLLVALGPMSFLLMALFDQPPETPATLKYSEFIQQVQDDKINRVVMFSDRTRAIAIRGEEKFQVNLLPDTNLIDILTKNDVDITVRPPQDDRMILGRLARSLGLVVLQAGGFLVLVILVIKKFMRR